MFRHMYCVLGNRSDNVSKNWYLEGSSESEEKWFDPKIRWFRNCPAGVKNPGPDCPWMPAVGYLLQNAIVQRYPLCPAIAFEFAGVFFRARYPSSIPDRDSTKKSLPEWRSTMQRKFPDETKGCKIYQIKQCVAADLVSQRPRPSSGRILFFAAALDACFRWFRPAFAIKMPARSDLYLQAGHFSPSEKASPA